MERELIKEENCKSVELAIMVEVGANVREMGVMTKELRANRFHSEYVSIIAEIPDTRFEDEIVCVLVCSIASRECERGK